MDKALQHSHWKDRHTRVIEPHARMSTAQRTIASAAPIAVSFSHPKMDPDELRRVSARVLNMQLLIKHVFDDSLAALALQTEMAPDRLRSLMDMHVPFSSEIAEHLEKCLNLPGGWLDNKRSTIDADHLRAIIFAPPASHSHEASVSPSALEADQVTEDASEKLHMTGYFEDSAFGNEPVGPETQSIANPGAKSAAAEVDLSLPDASSSANLASPSLPALLHNTQSPQTESTKPQQQNATTGNQERCDMETRTEKAEKGKTTESSRAEPKRLNDPVTQTLIWLNHELDRYRSSKGGPVRPEIAEIMGRAPSTVSTWMTGVRKMPDEMVIPLVLAVYKIRLPIADEFFAKMKAAAPAIMRQMPEIPKVEALAETQATEGTQDLASDRSTKDTQAPANATSPESTHQAPSAPSTNELQGLDAAMEQDLLPLGQQGNNEEFKLTVARAADRVASVLQRLMDR